MGKGKSIVFVFSYHCSIFFVITPLKRSRLFTFRELVEQVAEFEKSDFKTTNKVITTDNCLSCRASKPSM